MKYLLYILISLLSCFAANAQITVYQTSGVDTSGNILYSDIKNYVVIKNLPQGVSLSLSRGTVKPYYNYNYVLQVDDIGKDTLFVRKNDSVIFQKVFDVECSHHFEFGLGRFSFSGNAWDKFSVAQILEDPTLKLVPGKCPLKFKLVSLFITIRTKQMFGSSEDVPGGRIPQAILDQIKTMHSGDQIYLDDIKIRGADGRVRMLLSRAIRIQ